MLLTETFNSKLLTPDLSEQDLIDLHQELKEVCQAYCLPTAIDRIQFDDDIVEQLAESMGHSSCDTTFDIVYNFFNSQLRSFLTTVMFRQPSVAFFGN